MICQCVSPRRNFPESSIVQQQLIVVVILCCYSHPIFQHVQPSWHQVVFANESIPLDAQRFYMHFGPGEMLSVKCRPV